MTEHQRLIKINDKIWYINKEYFFWTVYITQWMDERKVDVREIIYTPEFMDKYTKNILVDDMDFREELFKHLEDPTLYLYNLLGLWVK